MIGVETVAVFYSILALIANAATVAVGVLVATGQRERLRDRLGASSLAGAFVVATLATLGSLYFSEVGRFEPCRLCWYQRIAMYPLVIVLGVAAWRGDAGVRWYVVPLAAVGALIAGYHYALEWLPWLDSGVCSASTPCTLVWFREFGFISLPYLALSAFLFTLALVSFAPGRAADDREDPLPGRPS